MGRLIFITGGVRSGKSSYAISLAKKEKGEVLFVATAFASDEEMKARIENHRRERPLNWKTLEIKGTLEEILKVKGFQIAILDCLTLYVARRMEQLAPQKLIDEIKEATESLKKEFELTIIVSNEVGSGVVPTTYAGRKFADILGWANQVVSRTADEVYLMVSGIPVCLKGKK